ncbi:MAG: hypothetical protein ABFS03_08195 [Chloroflexota bacterium]
MASLLDTEFTQIVSSATARRLQQPAGRNSVAYEFVPKFPINLGQNEKWKVALCDLQLYLGNVLVKLPDGRVETLFYDGRVYRQKPFKNLRVGSIGFFASPKFSEVIPNDFLKSIAVRSGVRTVIETLEHFDLAISKPLAFRLGFLTASDPAPEQSDPNMLFFARNQKHTAQFLPSLPPLKLRLDCNHITPSTWNDHGLSRTLHHIFLPHTGEFLRYGAWQSVSTSGYWKLPSATKPIFKRVDQILLPKIQLFLRNADDGSDVEFSSTRHDFVALLHYKRDLTWERFF